MLYFTAIELCIVQKIMSHNRQYHLKFYTRTVKPALRDTPFRGHLSLKITSISAFTIDLTSVKRGWSLYR